MADRKAVNKYYPPEWEPKHGSINKFRGQHPLRERARKLDQGILIVRFEMPFNVWCGHCDEHIGKGVRYNAEKKQAGNYFSTKIWSFRMKCHLCSGWMEIHTDPENRNYKMVSGVAQKTETWTPDDGSMTLPSVGESTVPADPFARLEHQTEDKRAAEKNKPALVRLLERNEDKRDDYFVSQVLRRDNRQRKKQEQELKKESQSCGLSLVTLLPKDDIDQQQAQQIRFQSRPSTARLNRVATRSGPLLAPQTQSTTLQKKQATLQALSKARKSKLDINRLRVEPSKPSKPVFGTLKLAVKVSPTTKPSSPFVHMKKNNEE